MNTVFFNHIDRSESLESFIDEKTSHLHQDHHLRWVISRTGGHDFTVKCIDKKFVISETGPELYSLVSQITTRMKAKAKSKKVA